MYDTILAFKKFNDLGTRHLNGPRCLLHSFCCITWHIFEPLRVYEPGFNTDKYGIPIHHHQLISNQYLPTPAYPITRANHCFKFQHYTSRTTMYCNSFFPRTIPKWNNLPPNNAESDDLNLFKRNLSTYNA